MTDRDFEAHKAGNTSWYQLYCAYAARMGPDWAAVLRRCAAGGKLTLQERAAGSPEPIYGPGAPLIHHPAYSPRMKDFSGATVLTQILSEAGIPLHYKEIFARATAKGFVFGGKDPLRNLRARLAGSKLFVSVGQGRWELCQDTQEAVA